MRGCTAPHVVEDLSRLNARMEATKREVRSEDGKPGKPGSQAAKQPGSQAAKQPSSLGGRHRVIARLPLHKQEFLIWTLAHMYRETSSSASNLRPGFASRNAHVSAD